ncbi:DUF1294 domain-containing protein [Bacillus sp. SL00103]
MSVLLGVAGSYVGMQYFRHKTKKHPAFQIGMPVLIILVQLIILGYIKFI